MLRASHVRLRRAEEQSEIERARLISALEEVGKEAARKQWVLPPPETRNLSAPPRQSSAEGARAMSPARGAEGTRHISPARRAMPRSASPAVRPGSPGPSVGPAMSSAGVSSATSRHSALPSGSVVYDPFPCSNTQLGNWPQGASVYAVPPVLPPVGGSTGGSSVAPDGSAAPSAALSVGSLPAPHGPATLENYHPQARPRGTPGARPPLPPSLPY
jgi:hypothetical protein